MTKTESPLKAKLCIYNTHYIPISEFTYFKGCALSIQTLRSVSHRRCSLVLCCIDCCCPFLKAEPLLQKTKTGWAAFNRYERKKCFYYPLDHAANRQAGLCRTLQLDLSQTRIQFWWKKHCVCLPASLVCFHCPALLLCKPWLTHEWSSLARWWSLVSKSESRGAIIWWWWHSGQWRQYGRHFH